MNLPAARPVCDWIWSGKAGSLLRLAGLVRASRVPPSLRLTALRWRADRAGILAQLQSDFVDKLLAVRSSHATEDSHAASLAGRYLSRLDVAANDAHAVAAAIDAVFASYASVAAQDEVLLQPMVAARLAVVASTHAIEDGAPYYAFSLAAGARSDAVTRGDVAVRTVYLARDANLVPAGDIGALHAALREVEALCGGAPLEAEFVLDGTEVVLLQARPLARAAAPLEVAPTDIAPRRRQVAAQLRERASASDLPGARRVLALMPDWNPAELLGAHPRPLALSVFSALIGRRAWHRARAALGYATLVNVALLSPLAGRPYVDVQASAHSLLPHSLDRTGRAALAEAWQARLLAQPALHDRYEFAIAQTCLDFGFAAAFRRHYAGVLDAARHAEYRDGLRAITRRCLDPATLATALRRVEAGSRTHDATSTVAALHQAEHRAALPYAAIARLAFVHETMLRSAVERGALAPERLDALRRAGSSVTREYLQAGSAGVQRYAFLRAGTFEITTPCLAQLQTADSAPPPRAPASFALRPAERAALQALLEETDLNIDADRLLAGYIATRQAREYAKYILSRKVSDLLEGLAEDASARGLSREDLSWIALPDLLANNDAGSLRQRAAAARTDYRRDALLRMPPVLRVGDALEQVVIEAGLPNFVGSGRLVAAPVRVRAGSAPGALPLHAVVAIESADPGYDWIFARAPAALITAYGGPNSHMAIRCAELGVPAVLGLGVERWRRLAGAARVSIDADAQSIASWPKDFEDA